MGRDFTGEKYDPNSDVADIAKWVRKDIKEAVAAGQLPSAKYSVTIQRFSGGCSLSVHIGPVPFDIHETSAIMASTRSVFDGEWYTPQARLTEKRVHQIVCAYNRDDSDIQTDYFNVHFYDHVGWSNEALDLDRKRITTREGATGCSNCRQLGCNECAPAGYVSPSPVWHIDASEQLRELEKNPEPFKSLPEEVKRGTASDPVLTLVPKPDPLLEPEPEPVEKPKPQVELEIEASPTPKPNRRLLQAYRVTLERDRSLVVEELPAVSHSVGLARLVKEILPDDGTEHFGVLLVDVKNKVIGQLEISHGGLASTCVVSREVFRGAIAANAGAIVAYHNHPSGEPFPSGDDLRLTSDLMAAGKIIGIRLLDHVIVGDGTDRYYSWAEKGKIRD